MATIVQIKQLNSHRQWLGYDFKLSDGRHLCVKMDNDQQCCEQFGAYLEVNGKFTNDVSTELSFVGAQVQSIAVSNKEITECLYNQKNDHGEAIIHVTMTTSKGTLVVYLYNQHNGYYKHDYVIEIGRKIIRGKL